MKTIRYGTSSIDLVARGRRFTSLAYPLEFEMGGRAFAGGLDRVPGPRGVWRYRGLLADEKGVFLSCDIRFKSERLGGRTVLKETRTYRALRDLDQALLTVRYALDPVDKPGDGFLVIPALWYGTNEAWQDKILYPKGLDRDWSFRADGSSCPSVVWTTRKGSYAVATDASVAWPGGRPGVDDILGIGFSGFPGSPKAVFTFPAQEIPHAYRHARKYDKPLRPRVDWKRGRTLTLTLWHHAGPPRRDFHACVWKAHHARAPKSLRYPSLRLEDTARQFVKCMKQSHFAPGKGFSHRHDFTEIFSGWCGGFAAAYSAILHGASRGDGELARMGGTMCDFVCRNGISPSGIFHSEYFKGLWWQKTVWGTGQGLHMRNPSEGCSYLALLLEHERSSGRERPLWDRALRSNLDTIVKLQRADGAIPHEVDGKNGKPLSWYGATAGAWAGALAVYARIDPDRMRARLYLKAAEKCGAYYLRNHVEKEVYVGGPYDTYMAPNMEDPYNLLLAYSELYRTTRNKRWLKAARRVADHLLSWRYLYDARFPDGTVCRKYRVKTYAMSPASVSNKHMQNWDTLADVYLLRLAKWLKDPSYRDAAVQHMRASTQLVQKGNLPKGIPPGGQSEQWYATEFFWFGDCGKYGKGNLWQISVVLPKAGFLLALEELRTNLTTKTPRAPRKKKVG